MRNLHETVYSLFHEVLFTVPALTGRDHERRMNFSPMRHLSAWLPVAMSLSALTLVLGHAAVYGIIHEADEGTPAHIFQLLMAGQLPVVAFFAIRWLPQTPVPASRVLALQAGAGFAAIASVFFLT